MLAGQRPDGDPMAEHCGQKYKALIPIAGKSMLARVCGALLASPHISRIVILAQEAECLLTGDTADLANNPKVSLGTSGKGIATSIAAVLGSTAVPWPVLVTTADHALLSPQMIEDFLRNVGDADLAVGVGERSIVEAAYPETRRTWLKFSDGHYSGANLFALRGPKVLPALKFWSGVENDRKKSLTIFSRFGPYLLFRALTRSISFAQAMKQAGKRLGLDARPVTLPQAEAVIDVDKPADLHLVEAILASAKSERP